MHLLTDSAVAARLWRERRYAFAYRLGEELAGATAELSPVTGPAVYGIWLKWGLLYIGQTTEAARRLRDLPVGESHHLANTFLPRYGTVSSSSSGPRCPKLNRCSSTLLRGPSDSHWSTISRCGCGHLPTRFDARKRAVGVRSIGRAVDPAVRWRHPLSDPWPRPSRQSGKCRPNTKPGPCNSLERCDAFGLRICYRSTTDSYQADRHGGFF